MKDHVFNTLSIGMLFLCIMAQRHRIERLEKQIEAINLLPKTVTLDIQSLKPVEANQ